MQIQKKEQELEQEFHISTYIIIYKFILGVLELILGLGLWIFGKKLFALYFSFRDQQLLENTNDTLLDLLERVVPFLMVHKGYIILLLILLGVTKVVGAIGLYYKKRWGLDLLIGLTFLLLPFDLIDLFKHHTGFNFLYFLLNILIALYLVNFKPHHYFRSLKTRLIKN